MVVSAPFYVQHRRAFERPGVTEEKFATLVGGKCPTRRSAWRADFVVDSSQSFDHAQAQVRDNGYPETDQLAMLIAKGE